MGDVFKPRPVNNVAKYVSLTGMLFPWNGQAPVMLNMPMSDFLYLPCFSTEKKLEGCLERAGISWRSIKHIDDGREFVESVPRTDGVQEIKIILDPYWTEKGTVRFTEVKWD